jgi:hypothetical protein
MDSERRWGIERGGLEDSGDRSESLWSLWNAELFGWDVLMIDQRPAVCGGSWGGLGESDGSVWGIGMGWVFGGWGWEVMEEMERGWGHRSSARAFQCVSMLRSRKVIEKVMQR